MTIGHLWYVRRADATKGPFPSSWIEKSIALGRILADDFLSSDGKHWEPASRYPDFEVIRRSGERADVRRRLDERQSERRAAVRASPTGEEGTAWKASRRREDRRAPEAPTVLAHRQRAQRVWHSLRTDPSRPLRKTPLLLAVAFLSVTILAAVRLAPAPRAGANCRAPAAPGVNWEFCNRVADDLRGAVLRGAVLRNARLAGADLSGADLREADLAYADLSGAILREARLDGARLTGATLRGASLGDAVLTDARCDFADFTAAVLRGARYDGANFDEAIMPSGEVCRSGRGTGCDPSR